MSAESATPQPPNFEAALSELQQITGQLEEGAAGLEETLAQFERGVALLRTCYALLETAEQRIETLIGVDAEGSAQTAPFDGDETFVQESSRAGKRRSGTAAGRGPGTANP